MGAERTLDRQQELFREQKELFLADLLRAEPDSRIFEGTPDALLFSPKIWGSHGGGPPGVSYAFAWYRDPNTLVEYALLVVDTVDPFKQEFREPFKVDMLAALRSEGVDLRGFTLWPYAGASPARELIEVRVLMGPNAAREAWRRYRQLGDFNRIAGEMIRRYDERGCFDGGVDFGE